MKSIVFEPSKNIPSQTITEAPLYISWNFTYRCNLNCSHCYSRAKKFPAELLPDNYLKIVHEIISSGTFAVGLGGGEPLLRKDCIPTVARLEKSGISTSITTNGWYLNNEAIVRLVEAGLSIIYISLDGANEKTNDSIRGSGSFERALKAIHGAVSNGLKVYISTVVMADNVAELNAIADLASQEGVYGIEFKRFRRSGNGFLNDNVHELSTSDQATLHARIMELREGRSQDIGLIWDTYPDGQIDSGCPCGKRSLCIRPNGDICPCVYSEITLGNILHDSIKKIWSESPVLRSMRDNGRCFGMEKNRSPLVPQLIKTQEETNDTI